jgi:hypothetical protein
VLAQERPDRARFGHSRPSSSTKAGQQEHNANLRRLSIIDPLNTTRRDRIATISTDVQRVSVTDPRFVVEVPLRRRLDSGRVHLC